MITAKEAKQRLAESDAAITLEMGKIHELICLTCDKGIDVFDYSLPRPEFVEPIKNRLNALGFDVTKTHNQGITICW